MLRFLFWNLNRKPLEKLVQQIVAAHDIDIVVLAEMVTTTQNMALALNLTAGRRPFHFFPPNAYEKIYIFGRFQPSLIRPLHDMPRMTVRHLVLPARDSIIVAGVHLPSKINLDDGDHALLCGELSRDLADQEDKAGHTRTILLGDFNMNPFDDGVARSRGLNAVMTKAIASRGSRTVQGKERRFFYNPMWNHFGESGPNPPGTHYYKDSPHLWNMYDQVLVRPALLDRFVEAELKVLTNIGGLRLLDRHGLPDATAASDHLPLLFALDI